MATDGKEIPEIETEDWLSRPPQSGLPPGFRLLCIGAHEPDWVGLTLQLDAVGCHDPRMKWVTEAAAAMSLLRNETFDCLVVSPPSALDRLWDAESLVRAIRASGCDDPLVLLIGGANDELATLTAQHNCELLVSSANWNSRALVTVIQRSIRNVEIARENHQLAIANHRRLIREREEAGHLLRQQRDIISELESLPHDRVSSVAADAETELAGIDDAFGQIPATDVSQARVPEEINRFYQELLRMYVIMGSGNLGGEISELARILAEIGLSPRDTLSLHLERVEEVVRGLGNRSTRHVMARADLLALELIIHLGECYLQSRNEGCNGSDHDI